MKERFSNSTFGAFEYVQFLGADATESSPTVVLFHGFGADANDLASLAPACRLTHLRWIFPHGPLRVALGGGFYGRAWFPIDMADLDRAMREGRPRDLSSKKPRELEGLRAQFLDFVRDSKIDLEKTLLGGFSQGAMLATDLALNQESACAGLVLLSGTLLNQSEWASLAPKKAGLKFFQSHGRHDLVLGFTYAQALERLLVSSGLRGQLLPFDGGHEIPQRVLDGMREFILRQIPVP